MAVSWSAFVQMFRDANYRRLRKRREPQRIAYAKWVADHDSIDGARRTALAEESRALTFRPVISVVMPVYNAPLHWLKDAVESVRRQIYPHWELCIADDCSTHPDVRAYLADLARSDARVKIDFRATNGHISAASNSAIAIATGEFTALMDQDDLIPEDALLEVVKAIAATPEVGLVYTDEDMVDEQDGRESPTKKGPWHAGLLDPLNRLSHLSVYRTSLLRDVKGFRVGYEGAQDHDLALRCVRRLRPEQIVYVPRILYHWRAHRDSTARSQRAKPYALQARQKALEDHRRATAAGEP